MPKWVYYTKRWLVYNEQALQVESQACSMKFLPELKSQVSNEL